MVIVDIVANNVNNPGNSVFGPKGLICPGNTVTSMLMKSVADLKYKFRVEIEGTPIFSDGSGLRTIENPHDVFITFHERTPEELEQLAPENDFNFLKATGADE